MVKEENYIIYDDVKIGQFHVNILAVKLLLVNLSKLKSQYCKVLVDSSLH